MTKEEMKAKSQIPNYFGSESIISDSLSLEITMDSFLTALRLYESIYKIFNDNFYEMGFGNGKLPHVNELNEYVRIFAVDVNRFLSKSSNISYLRHLVNGTNLSKRIVRLIEHTVEYDPKTYIFTSDNIQEVVLNCAIILDSFLSWFNDYKTQVEIIKKADEKIQKLNLEIERSKALLNKINSEKTEKIYSTASEKYLKFARIYDGFSYSVLLAILSIGIYVFINYPEDNTNLLNFFLPKLLILSTLVTLATIFLRKASHLRKLHDQANQTSLELQALPLYLRSVNESDHSEIYKNLADKYFGKELDQTQNDKIGNLMQDQITSGTELIKASAEMLKAKNEGKE